MLVFPGFRTSCAIVIWPFCALGIWGNWGIYSTTDMPASIMLFFCTLSLLIATLYNLALLCNWHLQRRSDPHGIFIESNLTRKCLLILLPLPILSLLCGLLPIKGPIAFLGLLLDIFPNLPSP